MTDEGKISKAIKFPTPKDYGEFLEELSRARQSLGTTDFHAGTVAAPGTIDRKKDIVVSCGNLGWKNIHLARDVEHITSCPMRLENDAKLGGLSEALLVKDAYSKVLYITISTGIGIALIENGVIDTTPGDGGGRTMLLPHHGTLTPWEDFGSGSAIVRKYGKMASEITDKKIWGEIVRTLTPGFIELIAILGPDAIIIGGGAGHYLDRFHDLLLADLKKYETPMLQIPPILPAKNPDEAVIYGCYNYAQQKHTQD
jgi:glucokinase